ncbi:V-type ATP synthase subunit C [Clostridium peptidivorans]|uniref:V-type ATP synthase subunit C n=1 Tax=Clostridium peptidivorans TaxID=100174 RepID=UPI000BE35328|nr:V-type ATP synthase subunit C [Clostridium peptidivorans]
MNNLDFAHAIGRIRVLETRFIDKSRIDRMIESSSPEAAFKVLQETDYSNSMMGVKRVEDYEIILSNELDRAYLLMYEISPSKSLIDIFALKYDYHNIKVLLKAKALKQDFDNLTISSGTVSVDKLKQYIDTGDYRELDNIMRKGIERAEEALFSKDNPQQMDIILDKSMFEHMLYKAEESKESFIIGYIKNLIDFNNIKMFLRIRKQKQDRKFLEEALISGGYIENSILTNSLNDSIENIYTKLLGTRYEKVFKASIDAFADNGNLGYLEKTMDNYLTDYLKKSKYVSFGAEPIISYILAKETEIKIIRMIMVSKLNNISPDIIKERLRDVYV